MIENKLKFMLENNKLDGLINNKSEAEKLCKLGTTEEVLDLLNKYDYNETKEIFERELLEILQNINLTEEELNKVTGGKISHRQAIAKFLGVVSLAGAINMPTTITPVSAVAKKKDKNSGWLSRPTEDKLVKTSTSVVGAGVLITLLLYGGKKLLGSSDTDSTQIVEDTNTAPHKTVISERQTHTDHPRLEATIQGLVKDPSQLSNIDIGTINQEDLENYAIREFESWSEIMSDTYDKNSGTFTDPNAWNDNFDTLLKIRWAIWLLSVKLGLLKYDELASFTEGRSTEEALGTLNATARTEHHQQAIKIPNAEAYTSAPFGISWRDANYCPCIGWVCLSLLEIPLFVDKKEHKSHGAVSEVTRLSKEYFGEHNSPTDFYWKTTSYTKNENLDETIPDDAASKNREKKSDDRESSTLAELASLKAPNEQWNDNLTKIDHVVVSLIKKPVQKYTKLVTDISNDDLESYAKQGLQLWCENTKKHYDENTRSITNADTWNENFGLLVKIRWAVWLLLIKDSKVTTKRLQKYVQTRFFKKEACSALGYSPAWKENAEEVIDLDSLFTETLIVPWLEPKCSDKHGNVTFAIWNLTDDLPEEDPTGRYTELKRDMEKIATEALTNCMQFIETD